MTTLLNALRETAVALGILAEETTTSSGSTTTLVCSKFANTALYDSTSFDEQYVLIVEGANLGEQRPVTPGGLATASGTITTSSAFSNTVQSGIDFWMAGRLPIYKEGRFEGVRECVNRAMRRLLIRRRIDIAGVTDQRIYPLAVSTYPWMRADSILELYDPESDVTVPLRQTRHPWRYKENGESPSIEFSNGAPWKTGETASMLVQAPANSWLKISGTWTNQTSDTAALSTLTDETLARLSDIKVVALAYCYQELAKWGSGTEAEEWRAQERAWAKRARALPDFRRQQRENDGLPNLNFTTVGYPAAVRG